MQVMMLENERGHHVHPKWSGLSNQTKNLAHWVDLSYQPLSRNHVSKFFEGEEEPFLSLLKGDGGGSEVDFHFLLFCIEENGSYQELFSE